MATQLNAVQDLLLTNVSAAYVPSDAELLSEKIFPVIESDMSTGKLGKYGTGHLRIESSLAGGRSKFRTVSQTIRSTLSYSIDSHGLEGVVSKDDYRNVQLPFDAEKDEVMALSGNIMLEKEQILATALTNTAVLTQNTTLVGVQQFNDYANSDPISVFATARQAVRSGCGVLPNVCMMDWQVYNKLRFHPQLLDALGFKWDRPGGLKEDELGLALDIDKILIAKGMYESAKEGQASSLAPIWGKGIVLGVAPDKAAPRQVSLGYQVRYRGSAPRKVYKYVPGNPPGATAILVEDEYQYLISNANAAYVIAAAIA